MTRPTMARAALLVMILIPVASSAPADSEDDSDVYCPPVSGEEVVAGTSEQGVTLATAECTRKFRRFVSEKVSEVRSSYEAFFEALRADSKMIDALSRLIAREDSLSTDWIALRKFKRTLAERELIKPVVSRLKSAGMPPSSAQLERVVEEMQSWESGLARRAGEETYDPSCERAVVLWNSREAELLAILSRSLDEGQASVARAYYRERAEQRKKELDDNRARTGNAPCTIVQFKRQQLPTD
jgi:hypothetical protein